MKLKQAARALLAHWDTPAWKYLKPTGDLMADLREALAEQERKAKYDERFERLEKFEQAEQEPVGEVKILRMYTDDSKFHYVDCQHLPEGTKLYAAPVRTKDLTDDEITNEWESMGRGFGKYTEFARAVIEKFKEKNRG